MPENEKSIPVSDYPDWLPPKEEDNEPKIPVSDAPEEKDEKK